ncbi:dihydrofolate reductase family protein [Actinomadura adrarensis]|uniref:Dihydrofolate reductase family protein n=1 Tax=Actinomadura adrarensis TaxID=1819600 RepID=A0ABW3CTJ7_9ACTN
MVTQNITLEGVIDASEGWFSVVDDPDIDQSDLAATLREHSEASDAMLFGRQTFEDMRGYWPKQVDDTTGVTDHLNQVHKYVVSTTMRDPQWENSTILSGPLQDEVEALKARPGKDIITTGSITLVHALIDTGLVDEYRLFVYPVALGHGARLFRESPKPLRLRLVETRPFRGGVVMLRYREEK